MQGINLVFPCISFGESGLFNGLRATQAEGLRATQAEKIFSLPSAWKLGKKNRRQHAQRWAPLAQRRRLCRSAGRFFQLLRHVQNLALILRNEKKMSLRTEKAKPMARLLECWLWVGHSFRFFAMTELDQVKPGPERSPTDRLRPEADLQVDPVNGGNA